MTLGAQGRRTWLWWSSGKDSALALEDVLMDDDYQIASLLTTVTEDYERVSMPGVCLALLERQAEILGLNLMILRIPVGCTTGTMQTLLKGWTLTMMMAPCISSFIRVAGGMSPAP